MEVHLKEELTRLLLSNPSGTLSDTHIKTHFGHRHTDLVPAINEMLQSNRLQLFTTETGALVYKIIQVETAIKFEGLGPEQIMVYQLCEKAGNKGIWTRDIKNSSSIPQHTLTKTLKILEQRNLIKSVRSITSKSKKLYMLYDVTPAKEITGGPWYTEQEFDHEFVEELCNFIANFVRMKGMVDIGEIYERVRVSGISKVELSLDELGLVLQTLVYDGRLEEVDPSVVSLTGKSNSLTNYKLSKNIRAPNFLTSVPCGVCPVSSQCCDDGVISPSSCEYMKAWLGMADSSEMF